MLGVCRAHGAFLVAVAATLLACGGPDRPTIGAAAPPYAAATLDGDSVSLEQLRGQVVLLNLWATWCVPCRTETPYLQSVFETYRDRGLRVVGVSQDVGEARRDIEEFVEEYGVTYSILHDPQMRGLDLYRVNGLPGSFLIDREGVLRWLQYGPIREGDSAFLRALEDVLS
jgi:cytochrome c-type biogenesis protein